MREPNAAEMKLDITFLLERANKAGCCSFREDRDCGLSSNSIVMIAYGRTKLQHQILPRDMSDLKACEMMWQGLPDHRKVDFVQAAMFKARDAIKGAK